MGWLPNGRCARLATAAPTICLIPFYAYSFPSPSVSARWHMSGPSQTPCFGAGLLASRSSCFTRFPISLIPLTVNSSMRAVHLKFTIISFSLIRMSPNPPLHLHIIPNRSTRRTDISNRKYRNHSKLIWVLNRVYPSSWFRMK